MLRTQNGWSKIIQIGYISYLAHKITYLRHIGTLDNLSYRYNFEDYLFDFIFLNIIYATILNIMIIYRKDVAAKIVSSGGQGILSKEA